MNRSLAIQQLGELIQKNKRPHPQRVAVDGIDAAGKTTLADELAEYLRQKGQHIIRASADSFQNPRKVRRQRGEFSPEGFYLDSYDYHALINSLLKPLGPGGNLTYRTASFDLQNDLPLEPAWQTAAQDAILLLDGIFLLRQELRNFWEFSLFVQASFETTLQRALLRDRFLGSPEVIRERYLRRYLPGQQLYLNQAYPEKKADVVLINDHPEDITLLIRSDLQARAGA